MSELDNRDMFSDENIAERIARRTMTADTRMVAPHQAFTTPPRPPRSCPCELRPGWRWDGMDRLFKNDGSGMLAHLTEDEYRRIVLEETESPTVLVPSNTLHSSSDGPDPNIGNVGDYHFNINTQDLWHKTGPVTWARTGNLGPSGNRGVTLVGGGGVAGGFGGGGGGSGGPGQIIWGAGGGGGGGFSGISGGDDGSRGLQGMPVTGLPMQRMGGTTDMSFAGAERLHAVATQTNERRAVIPNPGESQAAANGRREIEEATERALRARVDRGRIERIAIENNDGNSLRRLMTSGRWLHTMLWRWQTHRLIKQHFQNGMPARIKSEASICWKGRSGVVLERSRHAAMQDMVEFKLDSGVVGERLWVAMVSVYDLDPLTREEHTAEMQAWYVRITGEEDRLEAARRGIAQEKAKAERVRQERVEKPIVVEPVKHNARRRLIVD